MDIYETPQKSFIGIQHHSYIETLSTRCRFVAFKYELRGDHYTKPPIDPKTGRKCSITDPEVGVSLAEAEAYAKEHKCDGVGIILTAEAEVIAIDLDDCVKDGKIAPWVQNLYQGRKACAELSPSGNGVRMFLPGTLEGALVYGPAGVEVYATARYVSVTGNLIPGASDTIKEAPDVIDALRNRVLSAKVRHQKLAKLSSQITKPAMQGNVWRQLNELALQNLHAWVPELFPFARPSTFGYRVSSHNLGRNLQEELSITGFGIKDFGNADQGDRTEGARTAIDTIIEHAENVGLEMEARPTEQDTKKYREINRRNAIKASLWLSKRLEFDMSKAVMDETDPSLVVAAMNSRFAVVTDAGHTSVIYFEKQRFGQAEREVPKIISFNEFEKKYQHKHVFFDQTMVIPTTKGVTEKTERKKVSMGKFWLNSGDRRQYEGIELAPDKPLEFEGKLNLWRGYAVTPIKGSWIRIRELIEDVLGSGDPVYSSYIFKWCAWALQNPHLPAEAALVFKGLKGTGKSTLGRIMMTIYGQHGLSVSNMNHLVGNFNAHIRDTCFLMVEEAIWPGNKAGDSTLKTLITDPIITIEQKGKDVVMATNMLHILIASNDDWPVPAGAGERRYCVFDVLDTKKGHLAWFEELYEEMRNGGIEAFLHDMLAMDLTGFHPRQVIQTQALLKVQEVGLDGLDSWFKDLLEDGVIPGSSYHDPDFGYSSDLIDHIKTSSPNKFYMTGSKLAGYLKSKGCKNERCGSNKRGFRFPPLSTCRDNWEKIYPGTEWHMTDIVKWISSQDSASSHMENLLKR